MTYEITDKFELDVALRYDEDKRENTTETPPEHSCRGTRPASTGQVRTTPGTSRSPR